MLNRRSFLNYAGAGLITTATMAEAGVLAEFLDWLRRKPVFSFAPQRLYPYQRLYFKVMEAHYGVPVALQPTTDPADIGSVAMRVESLGKSSNVYVAWNGVSEIKAGDIISIDDLARVPIRSDSTRRHDAGVKAAIRRAKKSTTIRFDPQPFTAVSDLHPLAGVLGKSEYVEIG